ncbi:MAG: N-acetyltransferase [Thermoplasmata archaeon]|nr:MAG: N-acetyltransferase [Thermoplasmata archaeon]
MGDDIKIVRGRREDLRVLVDLYLEAYRDMEYYHYRKRRDVNRYFKWMFSRDSNGLFIALDGDKVVGFVFCDKNWYSFHEEEVVGEIHELVVHPEYRNRGVGKKLVEKAIKYLGREKIELWVGGENVRAIEFYKRLGFVPREKFDVWLRMVKVIKR